MNGKFRVWDKEAKCFVNNFYLDQDGCLCRDIGESYDDRFQKQFFTGLQDKGGKDIYDGDVLRNPLFSSPRVCRFAAGTTNDRYCGFEFYDSKDNFFIYRVGENFSVRSYEIIGNIYENPELLK